MGRRCIVIGLVISVAALAGCGSSSHTSSSASSSHTAPPTGSPASRRGSRQSADAGELHGFNVAEPTTATNPQAWAAADHFPAGNARRSSADCGGWGSPARRERIWPGPLQTPAGSTTPPSAGLSVVEQFRTPAAARSELTAELPTLGPGTAIKVRSCPGPAATRRPVAARTSPTSCSPPGRTCTWSAPNGRPASSGRCRCRSLWPRCSTSTSARVSNHAVLQLTQSPRPRLHSTHRRRDRRVSSLDASVAPWST